MQYVSDNPGIADVTNGGRITALQSGNAEISIKIGTEVAAILSVSVIAADATPYLLGDINGDGTINAKDA